MITQVDMSDSRGGGYSEINDTSKQRWRLNSKPILVLCIVFFCNVAAEDPQLQMGEN